MTSGRYDCVVVGGGVAGLMTAARLSRYGAAVGVLERDLLGAGATTRNHGMVHSGALYARWHPEVVPTCLQAQAAYRSSFPKAISDIDTCCYFGTPATMGDYATRWRRDNLAAHEIDTQQLCELLTLTGQPPVQGFAVQELLIDTPALITDLAARCVADGVDLLLGTRVSRVVTADGAVRGVDTTTGSIDAANVVVCNGIGTHSVLEQSASQVTGELRSRLEMMMAFPGELPCALIGLEFGWPALAPAAAGGVVLASRYGAPQRFVRGPARWPVPTADTVALTGELSQWLRPGLLDETAGVAWMCSKTEHTRGSGDQWGTEPNYAVIDHRDRDGITGWWTVLPGKMTLALHASRTVAQAVTGIEPPLAMPARHEGSLVDVAELVDVTPWTAHQEAIPR
ncbi:NAD(P)/FAD-dependent oxidoreductase [Nocardia terpenica]|uniref:FAD-dependent oxidoreductase n=1 Tax=Nocardia terpenica TaxID=455432 RepID=A0A6G9ZDK4_9NOCA|nr:FAD-binding oxidoreductase [Nocardia terpenica]QIS23427.1 FAD-dependent oxidoreductase [Nocardia terpenica]